MQTKIKTMHTMCCTRMCKQMAELIITDHTCGTRPTSVVFWMLVDTNWTSIIQFLVSIRCLLDSHDKLLDVSETAIKQRLQMTIQEATTTRLDINTAQINKHNKLPDTIQYCTGA